MYEILKSVISAGGYKLAEIQRKAKKLYAIGDLTEAQMDELLTMALGGISPEGERPEIMTMLQNLSDRIAALEEKLKTDEPCEDMPAYAAWKSWDGISKDYQTGAVVSHNGKLWESVYEGQNVWEPGAAGTDELWVVIDA